MSPRSPIKKASSLTWNHLNIESINATFKTKEQNYYFNITNNWSRCIPLLSGVLSISYTYNRYILKKWTRQWNLHFKVPRKIKFHTEPNICTKNIDRVKLSKIIRSFIPSNLWLGQINASQSLYQFCMDLNFPEKLPHFEITNRTLQNKLPLGHGGQLSPGQGPWWIVHRLSFERYNYFRGISSWLSKVMQAIYKWKWFHVNVLTGNSFYFLNQILWVNCKWVQAITDMNVAL